MNARRIPVAQQRARQRELDGLRLIRPLTEAEHAEADRIAAREYLRTWRQQQREAERSLRRPMRKSA